MQSGMRIPVQIRKEETGGKGAFLTRDLTLAGTYVLLMPMNRYIGVSSRITEEADRERLRETGREIADGAFGIVMRAAALGAERDRIDAEAAELLQEWNGVQEKIRNGFSDSEVLYHQDPVGQMIAEYEAKGVSGIVGTETLPADLARQLSEAGERKIRIRKITVVIFIFLTSHCSGFSCVCVKPSCLLNNFFAGFNSLYLTFVFIFNSFDNKLE